jgi:CheY-like chemotaxis protein
MVADAPRCRVLVVDDHADTRDVMLRLLRPTTRDAAGAESVGQALLLIERAAPEFPSHILLDLMLPDASGLVLLEYVRCRQLPIRVALLTASGPASAAIAEAILLKPDAVFHKPIVFPDIEAWLNRT